MMTTPEPSKALVDIGRHVVIYEGLKSEKYHVFIPIGTIKYRKDRRSVRVPVAFPDQTTRAGWGTSPQRRKDGAITMRIQIEELWAEHVAEMLKEGMMELSAWIADVEKYASEDIGDDIPYLKSGRLRSITVISIPGFPKRVVEEIPKAKLKRGLHYAKNK